MSSFIKYLSAFILTFSLISCQSDSSQEEGVPQEQQQQQPLPGQMQQPAPDVDVSESELETFTDAIVSAQEIQIESQREMIGIVEDEGMDVETYNKIAQAVQMGQSPDETDISEEDMEKFESVSEDIEQVQSEVQQKMSSAVEDAGMDMERFQEINMAVRQDTELQRRVQEKMQETQMQQQPENSQSDEY